MTNEAHLNLSTTFGQRLNHKVMLLMARLGFFRWHGEYGQQPEWWPLAVVKYRPGATTKPMPYGDALVEHRRYGVTTSIILAQASGQVASHAFDSFIDWWFAMPPYAPAWLPRSKLFFVIWMSAYIPLCILHSLVSAPFFIIFILGCGLLDCALGLAAWINRKYSSWVDHGQND